MYGIDLQGIPVNRKIIYMLERIQKHRTLAVIHGEMLNSEDVLGRRNGRQMFFNRLLFN